MAYDPARGVVSIEEARHILAGAVTPITRTERIPLSGLAGRVVAESIVATFDVPPFARATMDGYAVLAADSATASPSSPVTLRVLETIYTGAVGTRRVTAGTCSGIATGAPIPEGADAVVMVERTRRAGNDVLVEAAVQPGQNVTPQGSDVSAGAVALQAGAWLSPARVGVVAVLGRTSALVYGRPNVAILVTGDEVVAAGSPLRPGQVHDVNSHTLAAIVESNGGTALRLDIAPDDPQQIGDVIDSVGSADIVLASGGSSVGEHDYILDLLRARGDILFEGIAVKPGMPTVCARLGSRLVFGMPGNPTSCLSNAYLFVAPVLRAIARLPPVTPRIVSGRLTRAVTSPPDRHQFYPAHVAGDEIVPVFKGSGDITSLAPADGYFEIPVGVGSVDAGTIVNVTMF
jgi:molybdopterin molybdotransferase